MINSCAWVTHCLGEGDFEKALVLGKSLRRVLTRKSLVVIVHSDISPKWARALQETFDFVFPIHDWNSGCLKDLLPSHSFALTFALTFTFFKKCIFLNPGSLVLKNCDDLFEAAAAQVKHDEGAEVNEADAPLMFAPSQEAFQKLSETLLQFSTDDFCNGNILDWILGNNNKSDSVIFTPLNGPHFASVCLDEKRVLKDEGKLAIVSLKSLPSKMQKLKGHDWEDAGLLEKFVYGRWLDLYLTDGKAQIKESIDLDRPILPLLGGRTNDREPIAVVGMSCRLPSSNNLKEFWNLIIEGRDGITYPPEDRWTKEKFPYYEKDDTQAGFLSVPVDEFDAKFFGISPKEVMYMDPQIRILHEVVWEGLEDAGINPSNLRGTSTGVFLGSYQNDYVNILQASNEGEGFRTWMGNSISAGAARISHLLGLTGPSVGTNPACSASLASLHNACVSLRNGECSVALASAVNLCLLPFSHTSPGLDAITSPDCHCKSFDASADGFGRAEGCTVLILKKLSEAVKDGDRIWGLIRGTAITQEGLSRSMGTPTAACEAKAMRNALRDGNVNPADVSFVEAHGTGTVVGDTTEIHAIGHVYGNVKREQPLIIGSVKTNVGHTEACSGITGIIKVLLSMKNQVIPRHRNFNELNPNIDLDIIPARLPLETVDWPKIPGGKPRMAGVCSFGFTGMDGHAVLEEYDDSYYPKQKTSFAEYERPLHILKVSAKSEEALTELLERYKSSFSSDLTSEATRFSDIAYTANVGRASFPYRAALIAPDITSAGSMLESGKIIKQESSIEGDSTNICFLFTGQGSQYHGMSKQLYSTCPIFRTNFDYCSNFLMTRYGISISEVFFSKEEESSKDAHRTLYSQTGIFVVEYCLLKLWESWGIRPNVVLGHSLGEFCAAVAAGILDLDDALTLVAERSLLIERLLPGKMLVIKLSASGTEEQLNTFKEEVYNGKDVCLDFAAINSPDQTVLAGDSELIQEFKLFLKNNGEVKSSLLQSTHAFHSRQMDPMLDAYRSVAEKITNKWSSKKGVGVTFISGMMGKVVEASEVDSDYWVRHTREKVNFLEASKAAYGETGCQIFLELGPHPVLSAMTMMNNNSSSNNALFLPSLRRNEPDWETILTSLGKLFVNGKVSIDWEGFDQFYSRSKVGHHLPTYPFKRIKFWPKVTALRTIELHPLLGSAIPNPTQAKLFQSEVRLDDDKLEYLKDHMIGENVVFPGAGYMEMLLMAGHAAMEGLNSSSHLPKRPISINNFKTKAVLGLQDDQSVFCQTIVHPADSSSTQEVEGFPVEMYHEVVDGDSSQWISHASATFAPFFNNNNSQEDPFRFYQDPQQNLQNIQVIKASEDGNGNFGKDLYETVRQVGLVFGPTFRTLETLWRDDETQQLLAQVPVPKQSEKYLLHPTLIDAMVQLALFQEKGIFNEDQHSNKKLFVPTGCEKLIWFAPLQTDICYVHINYQEGSNHPAVILDGDGNLIAALCGITAVETALNTIKAMLETQVKSRPDFFTVEWKPTLGPFQNRVDFNIAPNPVRIVEEEQTDLTDYSEQAMLIVSERNSLIACHITGSFLRLGWSPNLNDRFTLEEFANKLQIVQEHRKLLRQYLMFLEEDGILKYEGDEVEEQWTVVTLPMSSNFLQTEAERIVRKYCLNMEDVDKGVISLINSLGQSLDKILTGEKSALEILFPESESMPSAKKFYQYFDKPIQKVREFWAKQLASLKETYNSLRLPLPVLKILEVGAGTGVASQPILEALHEAEVPFEYVYTDISTSFFSGAEKRFEEYKDSMKFRKLNLEQDPSSQGFPPKYFDVVVAAQVVHATRDIKESILNIKQLLRDGGSLWLVESLGSDRTGDFVFGFLEGYWRFTDLELRRNHPMLTEQKWAELLAELGFPETSHCHYNRIGVVVSKSEMESTRQCPPSKLRSLLNPAMQKTMEDAEKTWLIFYLEEEMDFINKLAQGFSNKLDRKRLIFVRHTFSGSFEKLSNGQYQINPDDQKDMDRLFKAIFKTSQQQKPVEGIIVTWGITSMTMKDQTAYAKPFLSLIQNVLRLPTKSQPQLVLLTSGQAALGDMSCSNPSASTLAGMAHTVMNERPDVKLKGIDIHPQQLDSGVDELLHEIFSSLNDDPSLFSAFRGNVRYYPRFVEDKQKDKSLGLPYGTNRFVLGLPDSKLIQDLQFQPMEQFGLGPNDVEVRVKCSALNFKDVLNVMKPSKDFEESNVVGLDFSGVVSRIGPEVTKWKVGDSVWGFRQNGNPLPSHVQRHEELVAEVPSSWTFAEAATLPTVFCTAYYCIVNLAHAKKGETLLVHTASGGVGLAAIQIAKHLGLNVICTAGSQKKRDFLKSLGIQHVFNSRTTQYGKEILEVTGGKGVDIVLNSLTGVGFKEATLGACAISGARFIEMSKLNIWREEDVRELRPDVDYMTVYMATLPHQVQKELTEEQSRWISNGLLKPLPQTRFDAVDIRQALTFLQKAHHVGKVVCQFPETAAHHENGKLSTPLFNDKSTYLITGGLGGIGLEVCKYMVGQGARHIVLVGRKEPNSKTAKVLESLRIERNCDIRVLQGDIGVMSECQAVFQEIEASCPPLRGVMHVAGVLADGMMDNLKWEQFQLTYQSKVSGSWNLHELTKNLNLEHFVLFSSFASVLASPGQANYTSACKFEDGLAHFRNSHGLPATTINWGQFGEVGLAAEADLPIARPFSVQQGINGLDEILRKNRNHITAVSLNTAADFHINLYPFSKWMCGEVVDKLFGKGNYSSGGSNGQIVTSDQFNRDYDGAKTQEEKVELMKTTLKIALMRVLRSDDNVDPDMDFNEMGMDSLMMMELQNFLQEILRGRLTLVQSAWGDCTTVNTLGKRLVDIIEGGSDKSVEVAPTLNEVRELVFKDTKLPKRIQVENPSSEVKPSQIKRVLLTGATGFMGSHMLIELLNGCPQLDKIYCLIRKRQKVTPKQRLFQVLERNNVPFNKERFQKLVAPIQGNLTESKLGLQDDLYMELTSDVDAVIHFGAQVNQTEYYKEIPGGKLGARNINVGGLLNLLQFAGASKTKHVFNASSIAAVLERIEDDHFVEAWPSIASMEISTTSGYFCSQYVCDHLLKEATLDLGIPCKSFRYARAMGQPSLDNSLSDHSLFTKLIMFSLNERVMPEKPIPANIIPVEKAAQITIQIMFSDQAPNDMYNVFHPRPHLLQECLDLFGDEMGISIKRVDADKALEQVLDSHQRGESFQGWSVETLSDFENFFSDANLFSFFSYANELAGRFLRNRDFFVSKRLERFAPELYCGMESSFHILKRYMDKVKLEGQLEA